MGRSQEIRSCIGSICEKCNVTGGLFVQVGSDDLTVALDLGRTGQKLWRPHTVVTHELLDNEGLKHHNDNTLE
jgi:hypothetical protein